MYCGLPWRTICVLAAQTSPLQTLLITPALFVPVTFLLSLFSPSPKVKIIIVRSFLRSQEKPVFDAFGSLFVLQDWEITVFWVSVCFLAIHFHIEFVIYAEIMFQIFSVGSCLIAKSVWGAMKRRRVASRKWWVKSWSWEKAKTQEADKCSMRTETC